VGLPLEDRTFWEVTRVLSEQFDRHDRVIALESRLAEDLDLDSIDVVELVLAVEEALDMEVQNIDSSGDSDADREESITTIKELVAYIIRHAQNRHVRR
jgi:acyl carrier protein